MSMYLTRHSTAEGARWASNGRYLPVGLSLELLLQLPTEAVADLLRKVPAEEETADDPLLPPVEPSQEAWAAGVTYERSREARLAESRGADVYDKAYDAERPELFFKAVGRRAVGHGQPVNIRGDSRWNVPEPELVLVLNRHMEIVGYTAGNDMSSRDIEGENSLYLPQAKIYDGSCALGPGILLTDPDNMRDLPIEIFIRRGGATVLKESVRTSQMKRPLEELAEYLGRELDFPDGVFLMTGAGIVPPDDFTLQPEDKIEITVGELTLENEVICKNLSKEPEGS